MKLLHIDIETYSPVDLLKAGAYKYAEHPQARKLIVAVRVHGDSEVFVWDELNTFRENDTVESLIGTAIRNNWKFAAHNAQFEAAFFPKIPLDRWICTAAMCRIANIPASLEKAAQYLKLPLDAQKDNAGKALIKKFSIAGVKPASDPDGFRQFGEYCRQDVIAESAVYDKLMEYGFDSLETDWTTKTGWELDKRINALGIPVNVDTAQRVLGVVSGVTDAIQGKFRALTGLNVTQRDATLRWVKDRGYPFNDLTAASVKKALELDELHPEVREALELRQRASFAAVKKLDSIVACACSDGKVRGSLLFHGASTGRWAGRLIQPQNFKRPTISDSKGAYQMLKDGADADEIELVYGDTLEVVSSCIRHFIDSGGSGFLDADYSSIEARGVCWLAGQDDAVRQFRNGADRYKVMASMIFGVPIGMVTSAQRFIGKQVVLGCGYGMGVNKFYENSKAVADAFGIPINVTQALAEKAVYTWRKAHPQVVKWWKQLDDVARKVIIIGERQWTECGSVAMRSLPTSWARYLQIRLPSGRVLSYPRARINSQGEIVYHGQISGKAAWGDVKLYGGKIAENVTQAVAWDLMVHGVSVAVEAGFDVFMLVHDQALAHADGGSLDEFIRCLTTLPEWAFGFPLASEGVACEVYGK